MIVKNLKTMILIILKIQIKIYQYLINLSNFLNRTQPASNKKTLIILYTMIEIMINKILINILELKIKNIFGHLMAKYQRAK
jgi:hypothetical protein